MFIQTWIKMYLLAKRLHNCSAVHYCNQYYPMSGQFEYLMISASSFVSEAFIGGIKKTMPCHVMLYHGEEILEFGVHSQTYL